MTPPERTPGNHAAPTLRDRVVAALDRGGRFAGLFASAEAAGTRLVAVVASPDGALGVFDEVVPDELGAFASLTPFVPAAGWYEREIHDLFGIVATGHPRPSPLVLPLAGAAPARPRPGASTPALEVHPDEWVLPTHVVGEGLFTMPYGPVRSGVFESVEYLVETPGEEIPHVRARVFYKHRGVERQFEARPVERAVLVAERVEGIASVAHAVAFCEAVERIAGVAVSETANLVRLAHAELERVANHLDVATRLAEAAGLAVAVARFSLHKERVLRLAARMCGSRFGRGVVVPGGVTGLPAIPGRDVLGTLADLDRGIRSDVDLLMGTASFLDRLRGTGVVPPRVARRHGALGPVGRASGAGEDVRTSRPYGAYGPLAPKAAADRDEGDALARLRVRWDEVFDSIRLIARAVESLEERPTAALRAAVGEWPDGEAFGWVEAPQGEALWWVTIRDGLIRRCKPRSASFHNLALFPAAFRGDILTDFAFIEASFGLSIAGVAL